MSRQDPAMRRVSNLTSSQIERKRAIDRVNQQHCQRRKKARQQWLEKEVVRLAAKVKQYEERCVCGGVFTGGAVTGVAGAGSVDVGVNGVELHNLHNLHDITQSVLPALPPPLSSETSSLLPPRPHESFTNEPEPFTRPDVWTANLDLRELLDPSQDDELELGGVVFEYPLPLLYMPSPWSPARDVPDWQGIPLHLPPETDMDQFIIDTTSSGRRLIQLQQLQQHPHAGEELSQAQFPSISSLLNPNLGNDGSRPLTSATATHVVQNSTVRSVTTRIALMYILSHLMRWLVCRNRQSYEKLPDFMKPTYLQRTVPHPAWVDVVTWPQARDNIIRHRVWQSITFEEFRRVTGACMSVNWPYTDSGAFLDLGGGQDLVLSPIFENHIRRADNWTLSKSTLGKFPFVKDFCVAPDEGEGNA